MRITAITAVALLCLAACKERQYCWTCDDGYNSEGRDSAGFTYHDTEMSYAPYDTCFMTETEIDAFMRSTNQT